MIVISSLNIPLSSIITPESVCEIDHHAFEGTKLTRLKLSENCYYYAGSFPEETIIEGRRIDSN